jgi:hypothetical protein
MANYPEVYARVISPSNENSVQAMKARIEVLEFLTKANHTARTKEQWILGWKCSKELIKGSFFAIICDIVVFNSPTISLSNGFTPVYVTPVSEVILRIKASNILGSFSITSFMVTLIAKKLSIKQDVIEDLKTAEELFPVRTELEPTTILSI